MTPRTAVTPRSTLTTNAADCDYLLEIDTTPETLARQGLFRYIHAVTWVDDPKWFECLLVDIVEAYNVYPDSTLAELRNAAAYLHAELQAELSVDRIRSWTAADLARIVAPNDRTAELAIEVHPEHKEVLNLLLLVEDLSGYFMYDDSEIELACSCGVCAYIAANPIYRSEQPDRAAPLTTASNPPVTDNQPRPRTLHLVPRQ